MDIKSLGRPLWEMENAEAFALIKTIRLSRRTTKRVVATKKKTQTTKAARAPKVPKKPKDILKSLNKSDLLKLIEEMENV